MPMLIGVPKETAAGERRVAVVPEVAKKYVALGAELRIEAQAGAASSCSDTDYVGAGIAGDAAELYGRAQVLLKVAPPHHRGNRRHAAGYGSHRLPPALSGRGQDQGAQQAQDNVICGRAHPAHLPRSEHGCPLVPGGGGRLPVYADRGERLPQVLSHAHLRRRDDPSRARPRHRRGSGRPPGIATAKRLGAVVEGYDVRPETKEQVESLGAKFVDVGVSAAGTGGYARELTDDEKRLQAEKLGKAVGQAGACSSPRPRSRASVRRSSSPAPWSPA